MAKETDAGEFDFLGDNIADRAESLTAEFPDVEFVTPTDSPAREEDLEPAQAEKAESIPPVPTTEPAGKGEHVVRAGECISQIAFDHGLFWQTVWDDPGNAELRRVREDPYELILGDRVHIPELRPRVETRETEARHRFRRKGVPEKFHLRLIDPQDQPLANVECIICIDDINTRKTTDEDGNLTLPIPPNARGGWVIVAETGQKIPISLGELDPIDTWSGACDRLRNLGFDPGDTSAGITDRCRAAICAFQRKHELTESGEVDESTRAKLREVYGS